MRRCGRPGIITVFSAVSVTLIISLLLTMLEAARVSYSNVLCEQQTQYALQCYLGQYSVELFQRYGIYGVDNALWEGKEAEFESYAAATRSEGNGLAFLSAEDPALENMEYRLLTDDGGLDFRNQAAKSYLYKIPEKLLDELKEQLSGAELTEDEAYEESILANAEEALEKASQADNTENGSRKVRPAEKAVQEKEKNPIGDLREKKKSFTLSQVLPDDFRVSDGVLKRQSKLEEQSLQKGTLAKGEKSETDTEASYFLFPLYLQDSFSCALQDSSQSLSYQQEYFLIGKNTDRENLEGVVRRLLLVREMAWFAYRLKDAASRQQAFAIASALVGAVSMPALVKPVEIGILLAWSYEDGVKDVQNLMAGGKVDLIPGKAETGAQVCYENYLLLFLLLKNRETLAYRALDVIEEGFAERDISFLANQTITDVKGNLVYKLPGLFSGIPVVQNLGIFPITRSYAFRGAYT